MIRYPLGPPGVPPGANGGIIVAPPPLPGAAPPTGPCPPCPPFPPMGEWQDLPNVLTCSAVEPAGASIDGVRFIATPGDDLTAAYTWMIGDFAEDLLCRLVFEDEAVAAENFRGMNGFSSYFQQPPPDNGISSPFFMIRTLDWSEPTYIIAYQRGESFGDASNGLLAAVRFRILCIPVAAAL